MSTFVYIYVYIGLCVVVVGTMNEYRWLCIIYTIDPRLKKINYFDEDGIRTHAGRAHWISSPTP